MNLATKKWIFLKISSVILLPLMFWFANQNIKGNKITDDIFKNIHFFVAKFILNKIFSY